MLFVLPTISRRIFQTFRCQTYDNGEVRLLEMDLEIDCTSSEYKLMLSYAVIMCLVYPIGVWFTLLAVSRTVVPTTNYQLPTTNYRRHQSARPPEPPAPRCHESAAHQLTIHLAPCTFHPPTVALVFPKAT